MNKQQGDKDSLYHVLRIYIEAGPVAMSTAMLNLGSERAAQIQGRLKEILTDPAEIGRLLYQIMSDAGYPEPYIDERVAEYQAQARILPRVWPAQRPYQVTSPTLRVRGNELRVMGPGWHDQGNLYILTQSLN